MHRTRAVDIVVLASLGAGLCFLYLALGGRIEAVRGIGGIDAGVVALAGGLLLTWGLAAVWVVRRRPRGRVVLVVVLAAALVARGALAIHPPVLSTDAYRYVWDGRVQAAGINPYRYPPSGSGLRDLRDAELYPFINRRAVPTAYPPAAQLVFRAIHAAGADSVIAAKLWMVAIDLAAICLLAALLARVGLAPALSLLYAWHPLATVEVGHSGHVEAALVLAALAALAAAMSNRHLVTGIVLGAGALIKPYALLLAPALAAGWRPRALAVATVGLLAVAMLLYAPFLERGTDALGYVPGYLQEEGYVDGRGFYVLDLLARAMGASAPTAVAQVSYLAGVGAILFAVAMWCQRVPLHDRRDVPRRGLTVMVVALSLLTPRYPWYWLLPLALLPFAGGRWLAGTAALLSLPLLLYLPARAPAAPSWPLDVVYGGMTALVLAGGLAVVVPWLRRRRAADRTS